jgi:hypothetical protein
LRRQLKHYIRPLFLVWVVMFLTCWKWFNGVLKEANVQVTEANQERVDGFIHNYIGEKSQMGMCSADWKKASREIKADPKMKQELVEKLKTLV